jgi:taurine dioxygenase
MLISNIRENGEPIGALPDGEMMFHHDMIHAEVPSKATLLYSVEIPSAGGNTLFASGYAAYDTLDPAIRNKLEGRKAMHHYNYGSTQKGDGRGTAAFRQCTHPVFRTHEDTGKKAIYVNRLMTVGIVDMPPEESEPLLNAVFDHAEKRDFVYEHVWRVGDLLLWDNRCSSHARTDFPSVERRLMLRTTVKGTVRPVLEYIARSSIHIAQRAGRRESGMAEDGNDRPARTNGLRSRRRPSRDLAGGGAGLSKKADRTRGAVRCRRHHRQHRPAHGPALLRKLGPDRSGQQSRRRRQHDRHQRGRQGAARRAHPSRHDDRLCDQCRPAEIALRSHRGFHPITELASLPLVLVVHASVPATNLQEFIALAKSKPGGWDYASSGTGTSPHLAAEMFKSMAGIELVHVPFKGNAEAMNSLMGGHVKIYFALVPAVLQHIKTGALRAIAVTTEERLPYLPDVPTIAELGFPGYEISSWQGVFAPAGTPKDVVGKINGELVRMLNVPEIRRRISQEGADPVGSTPTLSRPGSRTRSPNGPR